MVRSYPHPSNSHLNHRHCFENHNTHLPLRRDKRLRLCRQRAHPVGSPRVYSTATKLALAIACISLMIARPAKIFNVNYWPDKKHVSDPSLFLVPIESLLTHHVPNNYMPNSTSPHYTFPPLLTLFPLLSLASLLYTCILQNLPTLILIINLIKGHSASRLGCVRCRGRMRVVGLRICWNTSSSRLIIRGSNLCQYCLFRVTETPNSNQLQ